MAGAMQPLGCIADTVNELYLIATTTNNQVLEQVLLDTDDALNPRLNAQTGRIKIDGQTLDQSQVKSIRFEVRTKEETAINNASADEPSYTDDAIYTLDGCKVKASVRSLNELPKGIYIYHRQKIVIK